MNIWIIISILFLHWVADFVCQTDWMAQNKSKNNGALSLHVTIYTVVWVFASVVYCTVKHDATMLWFLPTTFICHWVTDYFTSRLNSKLWGEKKVHWFFVAVGFDQFLHFTQLLLTYYFLTKS